MLDLHSTHDVKSITGQDIYIFSFQIPVRLSPRPSVAIPEFALYLPRTRLTIDRGEMLRPGNILNVQLVVCSERFAKHHKQAYKYKSVRTVLPADFLCIMFYNLPQPGFANSESYFK